MYDSENSNLVQDESEIMTEISNMVSHRVANYSNSVLVTRMQKDVPCVSSLEKRGSLHLALQEISMESFIKATPAEKKQVAFQTPRRTIYFPQEYIMAGKKDKLLTNSFVRKLPVPIEDKRNYRKSISIHFKRKSWLSKLHDFIAIKYKNLQSLLNFWHEAFVLIEGQHGAAIVAYFLFLRWLLYMNIIIFMLNFMFLVAPQVLFSRADYLNVSNSLSLEFGIESALNTSDMLLKDSDEVYYHENFDTKKQYVLRKFTFEVEDHYGENITNSTSAIDILKHCNTLYSQHVINDTSTGFLAFFQNILQGTGPLEQTFLFTGHYPPFNIMPFGYIYNVPFAFMCILMAMFIACFPMMILYSSVGIVEAFTARNKRTNYYSNETFSAWDYSIQEPSSADQQYYQFVLEMKTNLREDRSRRECATRSIYTWLKLYAIRLFINAFIVLWLLSSCYSIYLVVVFQLKEMYKHNIGDPGLRTFFIQFLPSLIIVMLNLVSPTVFDILVSFENYSAQTRVNISLFRNLFLYLSSIIVLLSTVYNQVSCHPKDICGIGLDKTCRSPRCWETYVGQHLYKLTITDMFVYFAVFGYDSIQYFLTHYCDNPITRFWGHPIFFLPTEVLAPVNSQTILWLGVFYSPLLSALMIGKLIIIFYIKKTKVLVLCDPTECSYRTSRFNSVFMMILLVSFFFFVSVQCYMVQWVPPSRGCGPFRYFDSVTEAIPEKIRYILQGLTSVWSMTLATIVLCLVIHYYWRIFASQKELLKRLKADLVMQSYDRQYLIKSIAELVQKEQPAKRVRGSRSVMDYVERLQRFDPEKLIELCRMHLSFTLDLHDDEFENLMDFKNQKKKTRGYFSRLIKDKTNENIMPLNQETISHIYQIIEFLGRDINVCKEGLFRKTGSLTRQNELKALLKLGENIDFASSLYSVHDCACVLKSYLAEMPEPLLSEAHFSAHCQITAMSLKENSKSSSQRKKIFEQMLKSTKLLLLLLPSDNYCLLKYLLLLLYQIQSHQEKNKMSSVNLATLFAPHVICPRKMSPELLKENYPHLVKCITFLIENAPLLFEPPKELVQDIKMHLEGMSFEGQIQAVNKENEPVKTMITFCDRTQVVDPETSDYTSKALSDLQTYIETLPNSTRKRKLIKKLQKETNNNEPCNEPRRKHFRSRSVGDAIKKHFLKSSHKKRDDVNFCQSTFDVHLQASKSTDSLPSSSNKAASLEALCLEAKEPSKFAELRKNFLRASRKKKIQKLVPVD